jgi:hypothetical protein
MTIDLQLSNAKVKTWRRCPKQYDMNLRPKRKKRRLEMGSWMHDLLMTHYDGEDWKKVHRRRTREFNNLFEEEREELGDLPNDVARLMVSYLYKYQEDDKDQRTVDTELDETITLPNGLEFRFIIDRVYEDADGGLWLKDYKTLTSFLPSDFMLLDGQLTRYFWCAEKLYKKKFRGIEFDMIRTKAPTIPAVLKSGKLTQKKNQDTDYWTYLRAIKKLGQNPSYYRETLNRLRAQEDRFFIRKKLPRDNPMTKQMMKELVWSAREILRAEAKEEFPRTPDRSCTFSCDYLEPCVAQLMGGDIDNILKLKYEDRKEEE